MILTSEVDQGLHRKTPHHQSRSSIKPTQKRPGLPSPNQSQSGSKFWFWITDFFAGSVCASLDEDFMPILTIAQSLWPIAMSVFGQRRGWLRGQRYNHHQHGIIDVCKQDFNIRDIIYTLVIWRLEKIETRTSEEFNDLKGGEAVKQIFLQHCHIYGLVDPYLWHSLQQVCLTCMSWVGVRQLTATWDLRGGGQPGRSHLTLPNTPC